MGPATRAAHQHVTAVLVSHDGARWLPQVLASLDGLTRAPDAVVAVDTASTDGSADVLRARLGPDAVVDAPRDAGFGGAVARGLATVSGRTAASPGDGWVWLLHDDCAPAPDALERLLEQALVHPEAGVVGPKVREWPSLRRLVEVGFTVTWTGRRETGLEPGEPDQGQHDTAREVLAVGTAGLLCRRDLWEALGGLDPTLALFGDDLDLGWRAHRAGRPVRVAPAAVVFHSEASARGTRTPGALRRPARREQRRAVLYVLLVHCRTGALPWQWLRLLGGSLLRALGLLALKAPAQAWDELCAVAAVHGRPWLVRSARGRLAGTSTVPAAAVRPLLPPRSQPYRAGLGDVVDVLASLRRAGAAPLSRVVAGETGPVPDEALDLPAEPSPLQRVLDRPWASTVVGLTLLTLLATRGALLGGELLGGALLPAPDGIETWWAAASAGWHPAGVGSEAASPPYVLALSVVGVLTLGDAGAAVSVLVLGGPVLAALTAHRLLRRVDVGSVAALWAALAYGALPLVNGSLAQGRLGTVAAAVLLPLMAGGAVSLAAAPAPLQRWVHRARTGLWAAALVAFAPVAWPLLVLVGLLLLAGTVLRAPRRVGQVLVSVLAVLAVPWALTPGWLLDRVDDPSSWWWEAGLPYAGARPLDPGWFDLALGVPGGPAAVPAVLGVGIVLAGVLALLRSERRTGVLVAWSVAAAGLALAAAGLSVDLPGDDAVPAGQVWVGTPVLVWWGGLLSAGALAAHDLTAQLTGRTFGWRQPTVAVVGLLAVAGPVVALGWVAARGLDGPLGRADPTPLPAYMADDAQVATRPSALVLAAAPGADSGGGAASTATLVRDDGWRLGEETMRDAAAPGVVVRALAGLLSAPSPSDLATLTNLGVGYVYLPEPVDDDLAAALDTAPGLVTAGAPAGDRAWRLDAATGTLRAGPAALDVTAGADGGPPWTADLPEAAVGRTLTVAALPSSVWSATVDGEPLEAVSRGPVQTFDLDVPAAGGVLEVDHDGDRQRWWLAARLGALALLLLLAAPTRSRRP